MRDFSLQFCNFLENPLGIDLTFIQALVCRDTAENVSACGD